MTLDRLKAWWASRRPRKASDLLAIEFDEQEVRVRVLERLNPGFNRSFGWSEVERVCFQDGGLMSSDLLFIMVRGQEKPVIVPSEARGGAEFFGALCGRGLFPEQVWRKAIGDTSGGTHCWPPYEK